MPNAWHSHLMTVYRNSNLTFKSAMQVASATYASGSRNNAGDSENNPITLSDDSESEWNGDTDSGVLEISGASIRETKKRKRSQVPSTQHDIVYVKGKSLKELNYSPNRVSDLPYVIHGSLKQEEMRYNELHERVEQEHPRTGNINIETIVVTFEDLNNRLIGHVRWLNDSIIAFYGRLLVLKKANKTNFPFIMDPLSFNSRGRHDLQQLSTFLDKNRTTRTTRILIPCNVNENHWVLYQVDALNLHVLIYNTIKPKDETNAFRNILPPVIDLLTLLYEKQKMPGGPLDTENIKVFNIDTPIQKELVNCGVYVCEMMRRICNGESVTRNKKRIVDNIETTRKLIYCSIVDKTLYIPKGGRRLRQITCREGGT